MYTGVVSSRTAVVAAAAALGGGNVGGPGAAAVNNNPNLLRSSTLTRNSKRAFKSGVTSAQGKDTSSVVAWPISTRKFQDLLSLDFNVWTYSPDELLVLAYDMFAEMRLIDEFQIIPEVLKGFLLTVRQNYHDNPFHNCQRNNNNIERTCMLLAVVLSCGSFPWSVCCCLHLRRVSWFLGPALLLSRSARSNECQRIFDAARCSGTDDRIPVS
jgi:hypothetical protein